MRALISPFCARGTVRAMPSKSIAHRAMIAASLAKGESVVYPVTDSEDMLATRDALEALGAGLHRENDALRITGKTMPFDTKDLVCRASGSTLRFLIPLCLADGKKRLLRGDARLMERPLSVYESLCDTAGLLFEKSAGALCVQGPLTPGEYVMPGDVSSQFISGMLFVLPLLPGDSRLVVSGTLESASYVAMTLDVLQAFGITVVRRGNTFEIGGGQCYQPCRFEVEGDYSNAAFWEAFNLLGGAVNVTGLKEKSLQGDRIYQRYFEQLKQKRPELSLADCPDLAPILMVVASQLHGARFIHTRRLAFKESDRGEAMRQEMKKCGIEVQISDNEILVDSTPAVAPKEPIVSHGDHRIVMAMTVLLSLVGGVMEGAQDVAKSDPCFFETLQQITEKGCITIETES